MRAGTDNNCNVGFEGYQLGKIPNQTFPDIGKMGTGMVNKKPK